MTGQDLLELRLKLNMSQRALGDELGISATMIGYMERGYAANGRKVKVSRRTEKAVLLLADSKGVCDAAAPGPDIKMGDPVLPTEQQEVTVATGHLLNNDGYSCIGCRFDIPGNCSNRHIGEDGYMHFPEGDCWTA